MTSFRNPITTPADLPLMLNIALAAKVSGYGQHRIRELCKAGRIPHIRWGRAYMLPCDAFLAAIEKEAMQNARPGL